MRKDIIIIDDDRDLCTLLQESLLQENICADISCNGFDGIKSVKDKEYQLVVLDVMMPGISGFEVLERIRDIFLKDYTSVIKEDPEKGMDWD